MTSGSLSGVSTSRASAAEETAARVLQGGGEMGELMRALDWSRTPLGPVESWSQALRTMVGLLLRNRFPLLLWWGPEFVQLYNDAYRPIPGAKHPRALGQPARACWEEIWHIIGPMVEAPFQGGPATWSDALELFIDRRGFLEETHFKVAYSPVPDESVPSGIGGVLATVAETTEQVFGDRQLRTLRDLAARAADAKTPADACQTAATTFAENPRDVPFALLYLLEDEGRTARLAGASGLRPESAAAPLFIRIGAECEWPFEEVAQRRRVQEVGGLPEKLAELPRSDQGTLPQQALVLPLAAPGQARIYGFLILGASPHRALDEGYRGFFELAAAQVVTAIRNARAYQEERERSEALAEIDRAKTLFFSNVSHEFRTPLTLMLAPVDELRSDPALGAAEREQLELVHRNGLRLQKLVNALLDFSRLEAGRMEAVYTPTDLAGLTADFASSFRSAIERAGLRLRVACAEPRAKVFVDRSMWEKIVLNLLSNAFKFTFDGEIAVGLRDAGEAVELEVRDTGIGIAAQELPRLFERFHRIEGVRSRSHEGSGIGLALVDELVRLHGGVIRVDSEPGRGTAFFVRIPHGSAHLPPDHVRAGGAPSPAIVGADAHIEEAVRWSATEPPPSKAAHPANRARIVVADDNADMRGYVSRLLGERWNVTAFADGEAALNAIRANPPDLVLSDVMMPALDGFGLVHALRGDPSLREIPIVLLSARAGVEATAEGIGAGADDYIVKPFTARELVVRVAARLAQAEGAERAKEQRANLYRAFMQAPFAVAILRGGEHVIELANDAALAVWDRDASAVGQPLLTVLPELGDQPFPALLDQVYRTGQPQRGFATRARLRTRQAAEPREAFFDFVYSPLFDAAGSVEGVMVCAFEVTQQVRSREALEATNRAKDEFLATMSHELRTPLTSMLGWAALLKRDASPDKLRRGLAVIERSANAQAKLVSDLLDVSRISSGKLSLILQKTEISAVLLAAIEVVRPAAEAKRVRLVVDLDPGGGTILADPDRLQQVVWNLLSNAVRFTPAEGRVSIRSQWSGDTVTIHVEDTGSGIAAEHLQQIFERFRQVDSSITRSHGGLGLGLSIVRHLVEAHGGIVRASSGGLGAGAVFTVTLPVRAVETTAAAGVAIDSRHPRGGAEAGGAPLRVKQLQGIQAMVVEDDQDALDLIRLVLEEAGARVVGVRSARSALEQPGPFDVVISDIGMPEMDGYMLMERLKAKPQGGRTRSIALTAYARAEDAQRALSVGYDRHLAKPIDQRALTETIREVVLGDPAWADRRGSAA